MYSGFFRACTLCACAALITLFYQIPAFATDRDSGPDTGASAQTDTLRAELGEVYIEASRLAVPWLRQPLQLSLVDSAAVEAAGGQTLGDALRFSSPVQIRTYGLGGTQSISGRGFSPGQTQLIWDGFSINHAMLGVANYALVPSAMTSNLRVATGNSAAGFGEGGAAGSVVFDSPAPANRTEISWRQGRWGQQQLSLRSGYDSGHSRAAFTLTGAQATNNYPYFDDIRGREERRRNNQFTNRHAMLTGGITRGDFTADATLWAGFAEHHISGSSTVRNPQAVQDDAFLRASVQSALNTESGLWQLGLFSERYRLDYTDPPSRTESESLQRRNRIRLSHSFSPLSMLFLTTGAEAGLADVETNNFAGRERQNDIALFTRAEITPLEQLSFYPLARLVRYSETGTRFTGSLGANWRTPVSWLSLRAQAALNFSPPTLNDLYWSPGGNPDLKPEESITLEAGLSAEHRMRTGLVRFALTGWTSQFENGIRWLPGQGGVWSPVNVAEIRSRGVEAETSVRHTSGRLSLHASGAMVYTRAESPQTSTSQGEITSIWRQLTYVPEWSWKATAGVGYGPVFVNGALQQTGSRFTTSDHSSPRDPLGAITDLNVQAGLKFELRGISGSAGYTLHNVLERQYEFISRYPMPPRYHTLSLTLGFSHGN